MISSFLPAWLGEYLYEYVKYHLRFRPKCLMTHMRVCVCILFTFARTDNIYYIY